MTNALPALAQRLLETWARLYTLGLPASHRHERIQLLRADLFDQVTEAREQAIAPAHLAAALLSRGLRGLPDDLTWRLFEARRLQPVPTAVAIERRRIMTARSPGAVFLAFAAACAWLLVLVLAVTAASYSLVYAGIGLALLALSAWVLQARASRDDEVATSPWPLLLALGIAAMSAGIVFNGATAGLLFALPLALAFTAAFLRRLSEARRTAQVDGPARPLDQREMVMHAEQGDAIAIETRPRPGVTRRALLRSSFGLGLATGLAAMGGVVVDFLWQRNVSGFGGVVVAGKAGDFPPGSKTRVGQGKFWLVNLTEAQGGPGFLALWQKCPHLGCIVPWEARFSHVDPDTGRRKEGWFRCPCHQSTYDDAGVRVYGPAPRSLDRMALRITPDGFVEVDTGDISKGADDNAAYAVAVSSV